MDVLMPQLGETVTEGTITAWLKKVGDAIEAGDDLFQVETDKVSTDVPAADSGVLTEIRVKAGDTVAVGTPIAVIQSRRTVPMPARKDAPDGKARVPAPALALFEDVRTPRETFGNSKMAAGLRVTPLARRLIVQGGFDVAAIASSVRDRGGIRIAAADVRAATAAAASPRTTTPSPSRPTADAVSIVPLNRIRDRTARRLAEVWRTVPHVYQAVEVDFSGVDKIRKAAQQVFLDRHRVKLTFLPFVARATCLALRDFPRINATFENDELAVRSEINLGIAVDLDHEGLVVPVVQRAGGMTAGGLAGAIAQLVDKARDGKLAITDLEGGTYSISNNGSYGTLLTTPIINAPQVAILSMDAVARRPVAVEIEDEVVVVPRPVAVLGQSFDHRAFDGAYSASFLRRLKAIIETRDWRSELE